MEELKIQFDFHNGPIWKDRFDAETGKWSTGIDVIDNDKLLASLDEEAGNEYSSLYSFDKDGAVNFDEEALEKKKGRLLELTREIISRAEELNDGSFRIIDYSEASM